MSKIKTFIYATSVLSGTIIGVGIFSLPYITTKVGFWVILGYFLVLGILSILIHLFFGELALETPDLKRLPGFARFHLGSWAEKVAFISTIFGLLGATLAYLIVGGEFLAELLSLFFGGGNLLWTLFYFAVGAILIFSEVKTIAKVEFWALVSFFIILILIFFRGQNLIDVQNLFIGQRSLDIISHWSNLFLPYGPILFSLCGAALIPEIEEMMGENRKLIKTLIPVAILIPIIVYLFFIYLVLGICGSQTTESALVGLRNFLGDGIFPLILFFGVLTNFTSFITVGLTIKKIFWYDLRIEKKISWLITCFVPLILFLAGIKEFIPVISFVGGVMLAIDGILVLLMYKKIKPQRALIIYPLFLILFLGIIYQIIYFFR